MRLLVENLPLDGRTVVFGMADAWARTAARDALEGDPETLGGAIGIGPAKPGGRVVVQVKGDAATTRSCDRCGEPTPLRLETDSELTYLPVVVTAVDELPLPSRGTGPSARTSTSSKPVKPPAPKPMTSTRMTEEEAAEPDEESFLSDEDLEIGWYEGGELDLGDILREALALELPLRVVCVDEAACDARTDALLGAPPEPDGAFHALKGLDLAGRPKKKNPSN